VTFHQRLRLRAKECGHILCFGIDPDLDKLGMTLSQAYDYVNAILDAVEPAAVKPNSAYFEALGTTGMIWLERLVRRCRDKCPVILDVKRGDIGPSSQAYARAAFERLGVDAVTVSPWMGRDSLAPFATYAPHQGLYVLVRTSNPGHDDLQKLEVEGQQLWRKLLSELPTWCQGAGAVVGATHISDLRWTCQNLSPETPLLIPGVGTQGGSADQVMVELRTTDLGLHRVNVSSKILYASQEHPQLDPVDAAVQAFESFAQALSL